MIYIRVTAGEVRVKKAIGEGEANYVASNVILERPPRSILRHYIIGLSCVRDVVIRIGGPNPQAIAWPNVICSSSTLDEIEALLKTRPVVGETRAGPP
jgi:hypothetical protein